MALARSALRLTRASGVLVQATRGMAEMPLTFAAPSQVFYNQQDVRQVDVPSFRSVTRSVTGVAFSRRSGLSEFSTGLR